MALQGTVDTFPLPEVMGLLSGSEKSGRLTVTGDRIEGVVWFDEGRVLRADLAGRQDCDLAEVLVALLRLQSGSFRFDAGQPTGDGDGGLIVEDLLTGVEELLGEYERLEEVVPNLDVAVCLVDELDVDEVTITASQWRAVALLREPRRAGQIGTMLGLGELETMRCVVELNEKKLVSVGGEIEASPAEVAPVGLREDETTASFSDLAAVVDRLDPVATTAGPSDDNADAEDLDDTAFYDRDSDLDDERASKAVGDIANQLHRLSPEAAQAVARAARATTPEEREEALEEVEADGSIDRDVLLRFLDTIE